MAAGHKLAVGSEQLGTPMPAVWLQGWQQCRRAFHHPGAGMLAIPWDIVRLWGPSRVVVLLSQACTGTAFWDILLFPARFQLCRSWCCLAACWAPQTCAELEVKELRKSPKRLNEVKQHGDSHLSSRSPEPREAKEPGDAPVLPSMAHTRTV